MLCGLPLHRLQPGLHLAQVQHLRLELVHLLDQLCHRFLLGRRPREPGAQRGEDAVLALRRRARLHALHRVLELGEVAEALAAIG